jgi:hypothetical protein
MGNECLDMSALNNGDDDDGDFETEISAILVDQDQSQVCSLDEKSCSHGTPSICEDEDQRQPNSMDEEPCSQDEAYGLLLHSTLPLLELQTTTSVHDTRSSLASESASPSTSPKSQEPSLSTCVAKTRPHKHRRLSSASYEDIPHDSASLPVPDRHTIVQDLFIISERSEEPTTASASLSVVLEEPQRNPHLPHKPMAVS